jgi:hypothetical protein
MAEEKISLSTTQQTRGPLPGETGYLPPTDLVPLPSGGKIYPVDSPVHLVDTVEIRSMTARDEDILTSRALLKQGKAISTLIRSCLVNKSIDADELLVGDRNAILIAIRITGYGSDYTIEVECPLCNDDKHTKYTFNLAQLPVKPLGVEPIQPGMNAFSLMLPVSRKEVIFSLPTGNIEKEISDVIERGRKAVGPGGVEASITTRLLFQIQSLGGETDRTKLAQIIRNLPALDSRALRTHIEKVSPGVEMKQLFKCSSCGEESEVEVPLGTEFFWPST